MSATLSADDFKNLISTVCRFPASASFAGSDQINLSVHNSSARATTYGGVVSSSVAVSATGELELISLPRKKMEDFAGSIAAGASKVTVGVFDTTVVLTCKRDIKEERLAAGQKIKQPIIGMQISITAEMAQRIRYLSGVCDTSRPELECVMLSGNQAIACSQQAVASLSIDTVSTGAMAIPAILAKSIKGGEALCLDSSIAILIESSVRAIHSTPLQVEAQRNFPLAMVHKISVGSYGSRLECEGKRFADAIAKSALNMGAGSTTELVASLFEASGRATLEVQDDTSRFRSQFKATLQHGVSFCIPLAGLIAVRPFLRGGIKLCMTERGDTFVGLEDGFVVFPKWLGGK